MTSIATVEQTHPTGFETPDAPPPLMLARLAALPASAVEPLARQDLAALVDAYARQAASLDGLKERASAELHAAIGAEPDDRTRGLLLAARRDLHRGRTPRSEAEAEVRSRALPESRALMAQLKALAEMRARIVTLYDEGTKENWRLVRQLALLPTLRDGIETASVALGRGLDRLARERNAGDAFGSREQQILRGALRYVTRASRKATPFATFCWIAAARSAPTEPATQDLWTEVASSGVPRVARLNKLVFGLLWERLRQDAASRPFLRVELNPSITTEALHYRFLAALQGKESFQRVDRDDVLTAVHDRILANPRGSLRALAEAVAATPDIDATVDEAQAYLNALVDIGLLRFVTPVAPFEAEWTRGLRALCESIPTDVARDIAAFCVGADTALGRIGTTSGAPRRAALDQLNGALRSTFEALKIPLHRVPPSTAFEDCGAAIALEAPESVCDEPLRVLRRLLEHRQRIGPHRSEQAQLRAKFDRLFPEPTASVPLLEFFERCERDRAEELKAQETSPAQGANAPALDAFAQARAKSRQAWESAILDAWEADPLAEELQLSSDTEPGISPDLDAHDDWSASTFAQLFRPDSSESARVLVPRLQMYPGHGKYFSRFLHVLPPEQLDVVLTRNQSTDHVTLAEIAGDENFNGNLHPPLTKTLIAYPAGDGDSSANQITCADIVVRRSPTDEWSLWLEHRSSGQRIVPLDLGFLNQLMRPALYRMLVRFSPGSATAIAVPSKRRGGDSSGGVTYRPRLVIDGAIVIARRSWFAPGESLPLPQKGEAADAAYLRLLDWWRGAGLPDQCYVRVVVRPKAKPSDPTKSATEARAEVAAEMTSADEVETAGEYSETTDVEAQAEPSAADVAQDAAAGAKDATPRPVPARASRDLLKPQFLDRRSPVLVDLLQRLVANTAPHDLIFEEQYPTPTESPVVLGEHRVAELLLQFDGSGSRGSSLDGGQNG